MANEPGLARLCPVVKTLEVCHLGQQPSLSPLVFPVTLWQHNGLLLSHLPTFGCVWFNLTCTRSEQQKLALKGTQQSQWHNGFHLIKTLTTADYIIFFVLIICEGTGQFGDLVTSLKVYKPTQTWEVWQIQVKHISHAQCWFGSWLSLNIFKY